MQAPGLMRALRCSNRAAGSTSAQTNFYVVSDLTPLSEVLAIFKQSYSHLMVAASFQDAETGAVLTPAEMAAWVSDTTKAVGGNSGGGDATEKVVRPGPFTSTFTGVITLEDVIEEVIDHEIVDEHDRYKSNDTKAINDKARARRTCACPCGAMHCSTCDFVGAACCSLPLRVKVAPSG
jgi:hypothetical protein